MSCCRAGVAAGMAALWPACFVMHNLLALVSIKLKLPGFELVSCKDSEPDAGWVRMSARRRSAGAWQRHNGCSQAGHVLVHVIPSRLAHWLCYIRAFHSSASIAINWQHNQGPSHHLLQPDSLQFLKPPHVCPKEALRAHCVTKYRINH